MHLNMTVITVLPWQSENTIQLLIDFGSDNILKQIHDGEGSLGAGRDQLGNKRMRMRTSSHPPDPGIAEVGGMGSRSRTHKLASGETAREQGVPTVTH